MVIGSPHSSRLKEDLGGSLEVFK